MIPNEPDPLRRIPTKQPEVHAEIGGTLRAARLKRGQSLEAVAQQTRIPKRYLEALEGDRYDEFPAFVYIRGFLKSYCDHLEVPFEELWAKIETPPAEPAAGAPTPAPAAKPAPTPAPAAHAPAHAPAAPAAHESSSAAGGLILAGALALGVAFLIFGGRGEKSARAPESTPKALAPLPRAVEPTVALKALDDVWVKVAVDGRDVYEGRLPRGAAMEWKPSRTVALRTTAPSALALLVNGNPQPLGAPSPDGEYRVEIP